MSYNRRMLKEIIKKPSIPNTKKYLHALILILIYIYIYIYIHSIHKSILKEPIESEQQRSPHLVGTSNFSIILNRLPKGK